MRNAQAAAGRPASMLIGAISTVGGALGMQSLRHCLQSTMLGFSKPESFAYAVAGKVGGRFGATNPPFMRQLIWNKRT